MDNLLTDLRYAVRVLRARPALAAAAVLSLAIGVGPVAALFSIVDALGFRPLPVRDPGGLLQVTTLTRGRPGQVSYPDFIDIRERSRLLTDLVVSGTQMFNLRGDGQVPEVVVGATVSGDYFQTLGVRPSLGRPFLPDEDRTPGAAMVAMISDRLWRRRFGADPAILGKTIQLTRERCTIVGIVPAGFAGTDPILAPDVWVPTMAWPAFNRGVEETLQARERRELTLLARLAPGATLEQARAELSSLAGSLEEGRDAENRPAFVLEYEQAARRRPAAMLGMFAFGVVALVLLVACANVAGLLLGRAETRSREVALRLAFGASRRRLVRQLLTESMVLAFLAAIAGLALAALAVRLLPALVPTTGLPLTFDFRVDHRLFAATLLVALCAVPCFGLAPALLASRRDLLPLLKGEGVVGGRARLPVRRLLVVVQISAAVVLLVATGFLLQSFFRARQIDPGFAQRPMVFATIVPGAVGYTQPQTREYYRLLRERVSSLPGVEAVSLARHIPLNSLYGGGATVPVTVPGHEPAAGTEAPRFRYNTVTPGYFNTMGTPLLRGRDFSESDAAGAPGVAIVNETMARQFWPNGDAVGQSFEIPGTGDQASARRLQVVGVARDAKYMSLTESPMPYFYLPLLQDPRGEVTFVARFSPGRTQAVAMLRREMLSVDPAVPILQIVTLDDHMHAALAVERAVTTLVAGIGALGLGLSLVGLYGVISFLVARRTRDIGIRMALGARQHHVVGQVLREGVWLALAGIAAGSAAAAAVMKVAARVIYGVNPKDPLVFLATAAVVMAVALTASWLPARHAARVDPLAALRQE